MEAAENDFNYIENNLKTQYEFFVQDLQKKKKLQNEIRLSLHLDITRLKEMQDDIDEIQNGIIAKQNKLTW